MIAVVGASGKLGRAVVEEAKERSIDVRELPPGIPGFNAVRDSHITINCCGMTGVDECERFPDRAHHANAAIPFALAGSRMFAVPSRLLHISTDMVFSGPDSPWCETDDPAPANVYGATKWLGERAVLTTIPKCRSLIVRTSWLFGSGDPEGFPEREMAALRRGERVRVMDDAWGRPTLYSDLAEHIVMLAQQPEWPEPIAHFAGSGPALSRASFVKHLCSLSGINRGLVDPITERPPGSAKRQQVTGLRTNRHGINGPWLPDWRVAAERWLKR